MSTAHFVLSQAQDAL
jgi:hypothetical protein